MTSAHPRYEFRVTKYDPTQRDEAGCYLRDEWNSFADVARGRVTLAEYERVEKAYVQAARALLTCAGIDQMRIEDREGLEMRKPVKVDAIENVIRPILREQFWARLTDGLSFVHFGWDYYMYVGVDDLNDAVAGEVAALGLFMEPMLSPYFQVEAAT